MDTLGDLVSDFEKIGTGFKVDSGIKPTNTSKSLSLPLGSLSIGTPVPEHTVNVILKDTYGFVSPKEKRDSLQTIKTLTNSMFHLKIRDPLKQKRGYLLKKEIETQTPSLIKWKRMRTIWLEVHPEFKKIIDNTLTDKKIVEISRKIHPVPEQFPLIFENLKLTHIILGQVGSGTYKAIYKVFQVEMGHIEALATGIHEHSNVEIEKEFKVSKELRRLGVDGVIEYRELKSKGGYLGALMEFCDRGDLFDVMFGSQSDISMKQICSLFVDAANTFAKMHAIGVVHRDIKPENVFVKTTEAGFTARIGDLGMIVQSGTKKGRVGTLQFVAPELTLDKNICYGPEQDAWSFGVMLYEFFSGGNPLIEEAYVAKMKEGKIDEKTFFLNVVKTVQDIDWKTSIVPKKIVKIIKKLLNPDPKRRSTIADILPDLQKIAK